MYDAVPVAPSNRPVPPVNVRAPVVADAGVRKPNTWSPLAAVLTKVLSGYETAVTWPKWVAFPS
jgi:hypothetical protein